MRLFYASCLVSMVALAAPSAVRIDSVDEKYAVQSFSFEVNSSNGRAGIRIVYENPAALVGLEEAGDRGPAPRMLTPPNLHFDASVHAVIYESGGQAVTCAVEAIHRTIFGKRVYMKPTGACIISTRIGTYSRDDGWSVDPVRMLDTYLETR